MKKCPKCEKTYNNSWEVCLQCRERLIFNGNASSEEAKPVKKSTNKQAIILIILGLFGLFAFLIGTIAVPNFIMAKELAKVNIPKAIIGTWRGESKGPKADAIEALTFYPNGRFKSEGTIFLKDGERIDVNYSGTYRIDGSKITYVTTDTDKPDICPIGYTSVDTIVRLTNDQFVYMGKAGNREHLDREEQKTFNSTVDVSRWMGLYYLNPDTNDIIPAIKFLLNEKQIIEDFVHNGAIIHFFASALQADKSTINDVKSLQKQTSGSQHVFLTRIINQAENFNSPTPKDSNDLDLLWSEFMAAGKAEPVKKIIKVLVYTSDDIDLSSLVWKELKVKSKELALAALKDSAEWSLASNAKYHKRVYEIIQKESISSQGKLKEKLKEILKKAA